MFFDLGSDDDDEGIPPAAAAQPPPAENTYTGRYTKDWSGARAALAQPPQQPLLQLKQPQMYNVGGIPGFHVLKNCFTEEFEKFLVMTLHPSEPLVGEAGAPVPGLAGPGFGFPAFVPGSLCGGQVVEQFHPLVFELLNLVVDSGLTTHLTPPDTCLGLTYMPGTTVPPHFDSCTIFGETLIGVSLGASAVIRFTLPGVDAPAAVDIVLPRRSIYIMCGEARVKYMHAIHSVNNVINKVVTDVPTGGPKWNPDNLRFSLTLRSTKAYVGGPFPPATTPFIDVRLRQPSSSVVFLAPQVRDRVAAAPA